MTEVPTRALLTVEEAARLLCIGRTTMYSLVSSGAIASVTIGRLRRVPYESIDEFVAALRTRNESDAIAA